MKRMMKKRSQLLQVGVVEYHDNVSTFTEVEDEERIVVVKDKTVEDDEESDGFSSDDGTEYSSSDSDSTDIEITGGYYTKEMFLKKWVRMYWCDKFFKSSFACCAQYIHVTRSVKRGLIYI